MLQTPTDMSNLGWEGKQRRRECCLGVLIVCSLSAFYVTTTHCFSFTYGWVPGMCFLSLFLMTWVIKTGTAHAGKAWSDDLRLRGFEGQVLLNLNFQKVCFLVDNNILYVGLELRKLWKHKKLGVWTQMQSMQVCIVLTGWGCKGARIDKTQLIGKR